MIEGKVFELAKIIGKEQLRLGKNSQIDDFCFINVGERCEIGRNVHISSFCSIVGGGSFFMGDFSGLSAGCRVVTASDDFTGSFLTNPTVPPEYKNVILSKVEIGRHAVIGSNCVILPGVTIGDGATVAAGCVIRKNLSPWTVYAEVKGKLMPIKTRDQKQILELEKQYLDSNKNA